MKKYLVLLVTLLFASGAWAQATCSQSCGEQNFNSPTDPFNTTGALRWSSYVGPGGAGVPIEWNSADGYIQRRWVSDADNNDGFVRYNGNIGQNGCMAYKIINSDDGSTGTDGFEPGFVLRHQTSYTGSGTPPPAPLYPTASLASYPSWNNAELFYAVRCEDGMTCDFLRAATQHMHYDFTHEDECTTFGPISEGGWIGACVEGTGIGSVIRVFNFGTDDPGAPANITGDANWGDPECTFNSCLYGTGGCDNAGNAFGIWMRTNTVGAGAIYQVDNARFYSCM